MDSMGMTVEHLASELSKFDKLTWQVQVELLKNIREALTSHRGRMKIVELLRQVCVAAVASVCNLRSVVSKNGIHTLSDLFSCLGRGMDAEIDVILPIVLKKAFESNKFIRDDALQLLHTITSYVSPRALAKTVLDHVTTKSASTRGLVCTLLLRCLVQSPLRIVSSRNIMIRLFPAFARLLSDRSTDARRSARDGLLGLRTILGRAKFSKWLQMTLSEKETRAVSIIDTLPDLPVFTKHLRPVQSAPANRDQPQPIETPYTSRAESSSIRSRPPGRYPPSLHTTSNQNSPEEGSWRRPEEVFQDAQRVDGSDGHHQWSENRRNTLASPISTKNASRVHAKASTPPAHTPQHRRRARRLSLSDSCEEQYHDHLNKVQKQHKAAGTCGPNRERRFCPADMASLNLAMTAPQPGSMSSRRGVKNVDSRKVPTHRYEEIASRRSTIATTTPAEMPWADIFTRPVLHTRQSKRRPSAEETPKPSRSRSPPLCQSPRRTGTSEGGTSAISALSLLYSRMKPGRASTKAASGGAAETSRRSSSIYCSQKADWLQPVIPTSRDAYTCDGRRDRASTGFPSYRRDATKAGAA